eukprot:3848373-Amphidinium_carterae.1
MAFSYLKESQQGGGFLEELERPSATTWQTERKWTHQTNKHPKTPCSGNGLLCREQAKNPKEPAEWRRKRLFPLPEGFPQQTPSNLRETFSLETQVTQHYCALWAGYFHLNTAGQFVNQKTQEITYTLCVNYEFGFAVAALAQLTA